MGIGDSSSVTRPPHDLSSKGRSRESALHGLGSVYKMRWTVRLL
jgi:hypothetical protein